MDKGLTIEQIKGLTRFQVRKIYFHPRDEKGRLILGQDQPGPGKPPVSRADQLREVYRRRCWPEHKIEELIQATLAG